MLTPLGRRMASYVCLLLDVRCLAQRARICRLTSWRGSAGGRGSRAVSSCARTVPPTRERSAITRNKTGTIVKYNTFLFRLHGSFKQEITRAPVALPPCSVVLSPREGRVWAAGPSGRRYALRDTEVAQENVGPDLEVALPHGWRYAFWCGANPTYRAWALSPLDPPCPALNAALVHSASPPHRREGRQR